MRAVAGDPGTLPVVRPPTWIEDGRLLAGRHPCAWTPDDAEAEVGALLRFGVTLFLDLTQPNELVPYEALVPAGARHVRVPVQDFTVPSDEQILVALDLIDDELRSGGVVYVHCWAGCGRTGVVVGCWLVRHGSHPRAALQTIAETRGLGCPQTLEQRLAVLDWKPGR
jgi:protein-tyrosine phosphatase